MNINANEIMLLRRNNVKMGETSPTSTTAPVTEPIESEQDSVVKSLEVIGKNNLAFQGVNTKTLKNLPKYLAIAAGLALTATSCDLMKPDVYVNQEVEMNVDLSALVEAFQENNQLTQELIDEVKALRGDVASIAQTLLAYGLKMDQVIELMVAAGQNQEEILDAITRGNEDFKAFATAMIEKTDYIKNNTDSLVNNTDSLVVLNTDMRNVVNNLFVGFDKYANDNSENGKLMYQAVLSISDQIRAYAEQDLLIDEKHIKMLENLTNLVITGNKNNAVFYAWLAESFGSMKDVLKDGFFNITAELNKGNEIDNETLIILKKGYEKFEEMTDNQKLLYETMVEKFSQLENSGKDGMARIFEAILSGKGESEIPAEMIDIITKGLELLENMSRNQQAFFNLALNKFDQLENAGKNGVAKLLEAINNNTSIDKEILAYVTGLLNNADKLNGKADKLIDLFGDLALGGEVSIDLSTLEDGIQTLIDLSKSQGNKLDGVNNNLDGIKALIKGLAATIGDNNAELVAWLEAIYDKIPAGHECDHTQLEKLAQEILDALRNESVPDSGDLGDILG